MGSGGACRGRSRGAPSRRGTPPTGATPTPPLAPPAALVPSRRRHRRRSRTRQPPSGQGTAATAACCSFGSLKIGLERIYSGGHLLYGEMEIRWDVDTKFASTASISGSAAGECWSAEEIFAISPGSAGLCYNANHVFFLFQLFFISSNLLKFFFT